MGYGFKKGEKTIKLKMQDYNLYLSFLIFNSIIGNIVFQMYSAIAMK
jgi:hypothetical protein